MMNRLIIFLLLGTIWVQSVGAQFTAIPDVAFEQELIDQGIDSDGTVNGQVLTSDVDSLTELTIIDVNTIFDMAGIEDFVALESLILLGISIDELNVSALTNLETLRVELTFLQSIDLSTNISLKILSLEQNNLQSIDITSLVNLESLVIGNPMIDAGPFNEFTSINISSNSELKSFNCFNCFISELDVTLNPKLAFLDISVTGINEIDLSENLLLKTLRAGVPSNNIGDFTTQLQSLDVSTNPNLEELIVRNTTLSSLNIQNGNNEILLTMDGLENDSLECILVDDEVAATNGTGAYGNWQVEDGVTFADDECTLSLEENNLQNLYIVSNPVTSELKLSSIQNIEELSLYDVSGKRVLTFTSDFRSMNVSSLVAGVYFVKVVSGGDDLVLRMIKK